MLPENSPGIRSCARSGKHGQWLINRYQAEGTASGTAACDVVSAKITEAHRCCGPDGGAGRRRDVAVF
jgi:hypothetical protein